MKSGPPGTKIALSIAGLLSLAAILYAANPTPLATVDTPNGVAGSGTDLIVTEYYGHNIARAEGARIRWNDQNRARDNILTKKMIS
jgi:hypothetical protein